MENSMIDLTQLFVFVNFAKSNGDYMRGLIADMRGRLLEIRSSNALEGRVKAAINQVILHQQVPLLLGLENVYWMMFVKANQALNEFMSDMAENEENAIFNHSSLLELERYMTDVNDDVFEINAEFQSLYRGLAEDISLEMPSNGAYERDYDLASASLRSTRECLEQFSFDYSEIRDLMEEIKVYVERLEGAPCLEDIDSRLDWFEGFDFRHRMMEKHIEFSTTEQEKLDAMEASWEGLHYTEIIRSLPDPMTQAEWDRFMAFMDAINADLESVLAYYTHVGLNSPLTKAMILGVIEYGSPFWSETARQAGIGIIGLTLFYNWGYDFLVNDRNAFESLVYHGSYTIVTTAGGSVIKYVLTAAGAWKIVKICAVVGGVWVIGQVFKPIYDAGRGWIIDTNPWGIGDEMLRIEGYVDNLTSHPLFIELRDGMIETARETTWDDISDFVTNVIDSEIERWHCDEQEPYTLTIAQWFWEDVILEGTRELWDFINPFDR